MENPKDNNRVSYKIVISDALAKGSDSGVSRAALPGPILNASGVVLFKLVSRLYGSHGSRQGDIPPGTELGNN